MLLATLLGLCAAIIGYWVWLGYRQGAVAQLFGLGILLVCYLVGGLISFSRATIQGLKFIPQLFQPFLLGAAVSFVLYLVLTVLAGMKLRAMDRAPHQQAPAPGIEENEFVPLSKSPRNKRWGMVVGAFKGLLVAGALFVGVYFLALTSLFTQQANQASAELRNGRSQPGAGVTGAAAPAPPVSSALNPLAQLGREIRATPLGKAADAVTPIKEKQIQAIGKLNRLAETPGALERFGHNPEIRHLMQHPRLVALKQDQEIARALREKRWNDLLNNPAVMALARDREFQRTVGEVDFDRIINESLPQPAAQPAPERTP